METYLPYLAVNASGLNMDSLSEETLMNNCGPLYSLPWEQWCAADQSVFPGPSNGVAPDMCLYTQDSPQHGQFVPNYANQEKPGSLDSVSPQTCPALSPNSESTAHSSPCKSEAQSVSSSSQGEKRKRRVTTKERAPAKSSRRSSKSNGFEAAAEDTRQNPSPRETPTVTIASTSSPNQDSDVCSRTLQERNRMASNKFRIKKREDAKKLKEEEEEEERVNQDLSRCVADLTAEVYQLKMKLLQHTDCNCALIQNYIANEAKRYIRALDEAKQHDTCGGR